MRLPGTNIEVLVSSNIIEIRNADFFRSIEYCGRKYEDVLEEIQRIMHNRGLEITQRVIRYILDRLGLPEVDYFPDSELSKESEFKEMLDSVKELTGVETEEADVISAGDGEKLNFKFHAENIPKETPITKSDSESKERKVDWEEAPPVGSTYDGVSS
ncbi:MAG: hypothetical protein ACXADC_09345 [Candidatus Thorarchaeota archaeon]